MRLSATSKIGAGGVLAALGGSGIALSAVVGGFPAGGAAGVLLLFAAGIAAGLGAALGVCGLYQRRREVT